MQEISLSQESSSFKFYLKAFLHIFHVIINNKQGQINSKEKLPMGKNLKLGKNKCAWRGDITVQTEVSVKEMLIFTI